MTVQKHGVHFDITAQNATDRAFRAVEANLGAINKAADKVGRVLRGAFIATAAISMGKAFATAAMEAEQASKRLDAVLKATGHAAGLTKRDLDTMADSLAESTQFDDESLRNASAQLLKFGNIHGKTFREGMALSADLAAFMGTDLQSAVQSVGKALSSPAEGVGTLERQIGKFTPAAEGMIRALVEQGRTAEAQAVILDTLRGKIGGTAEALNTGLTKAISGTGKAWDEMLEAIGRTDAFQGAAKGGLGVLEQALKDIKEIVENGTWYEKVMALVAFQYGFHSFKLTPTPKAPAPGSVSVVPWKDDENTRVRPWQDAARVVRAQPLDAELAGAPLSERDQKMWKEMISAGAAAREKAAAEGKRLGEERLKEAEQRARAEVDVEEWAANDTKEAWGYFIDWEKKKQAEREEGALRATESWVQSAQIAVEAAESMVYTWDEAGNRLEITREVFGLLADEAKKGEGTWRDLGYTMSSALEGLIFDMNRSIRAMDLLKAAALDVAKIVFRENVTKPLAKAVGGIDWGSLVGGFFGGMFKADGGPVTAGAPYIVGERGPELFVPHAAGSIVPNGELAGTGAITIINQTRGRVDKVEERRMSNGERLVFLRESADAMAAQMADPNSKVSLAMARNFAVPRSR